MTPQYTKRLSCLARDEDTQAFRDEVANEIGDCMALSGARRPLHEHGAVSIQRTGDLNLLLIGRLAEQDIARLTPRRRLIALRQRIGLPVHSREERHRNGYT